MIPGDVDIPESLGHDAEDDGGVGRVGAGHRVAAHRLPGDKQETQTSRYFSGKQLTIRRLTGSGHVTNIRRWSTVEKRATT
jgi:hypothetical protein